MQPTNHSNHKWDYLKHSNVGTICSFLAYYGPVLRKPPDSPGTPPLNRHPSAFNWSGAATSLCAGTGAVATENTLALALQQTNLYIMITPSSGHWEQPPPPARTHTHTQSQHTYIQMHTSTHLNLLAPPPSTFPCTRSHVNKQV